VDLALAALQHFAFGAALFLVGMALWSVWL
jgi:hypothetical protein